MKLLFDECIGRPIAAALAATLRFSREQPEVAHIIEKFGGEGLKDEQWVPALAQEDGWIVITADRGKGRGAPLHLLLPAHGVRAVFLSGSLHNQPQFEKARAILGVWPDLRRVDTGPTGTRWKLRRTSASSFGLVEWLP